MNVGITGGGGFIGGNIKRALSGRKGIRVQVFDYPQDNLLIPDPQRLASFVKNKDIILHTAAVMRDNAYALIAGNIVATYNLLEAVRKFNRKAKVIFLSSSAVDVKNISVYGESKKLTEELMKGFAQTYKQPVSILRLTNVFGEGSRPFYNTVVATFCYQVACGMKLKINRKGDPLMLVYVGDIVRIVTEEIFKKRKKAFYFKRIYTKNIISLSKLANLLSSFKKEGESYHFKNKFEKDLYKTYCSFAQ